MEVESHQWGRTILDENIQALFYRESGVKDDQSETERKHIVACAHSEKVPDGSLQMEEGSWSALRYNSTDCVEVWLRSQKRGVGQRELLGSHQCTPFISVNWPLRPFWSVSSLRTKKI